MNERPLSKDGEAFRQAIGKAGYEVTPRQLRAALDEAIQRVSTRPDLPKPKAKT